MRILCVNCVISEFGGVEIAAMNLAEGLARRGHDVHFLAASGQSSPLAPQVGNVGVALEGHRAKIQAHYREFPRIYPMDEDHGLIRKLFWHVEDLAHPKNESLFADVLTQVRPDLILLHNITAVGKNIWRTIRASGLPCIQVIHDLGLICLNMQRFRGGRQCHGLCVTCRIQKYFRFSMITDTSPFCFVSPSEATLREVAHYVDLSPWRTAIIHNANTFLVKPRKVDARKPMLLYIGRLEAAKGVEVMLGAAVAARAVAEFDLDILGTGELESALRQKYGHLSWVRFHGSVDQQRVAEFMSCATALLVPSLWLETVPGVAVHALFAGLPVLGSRIGGIPEHVYDGRTGRLITPGDERAWSKEILHVVTDREQTNAWSAECLRVAPRFDANLALDKYERLMAEMVTQSSSDRDRS
jgi:glycosyltransferase involved in cell wall biosynthesis